MREASQGKQNFTHGALRGKLPVKCRSARGKIPFGRNKKLSKDFVETPTVLTGSVYMGGVTVPKPNVPIIALKS